MKTIDEFRYTLTFRNLAGGSRSWDDMKAQRVLLVELAQKQAETLGMATTLARAEGYPLLADRLEQSKDWLCGLIEADIMAIDAFIEKRGV